MADNPCIQAILILEKLKRKIKVDSISQILTAAEFHILYPEFEVFYLGNESTTDIMFRQFRKLSGF